MRNRPPPSDRGFTLVEMMIVLGVIGILASVAIPNYQKLTARGYRSEMVSAVGKFKFFFKNAHDGAGTFETSDVAAGSASDVNPDPTLAVLGQAAKWDSKRKGWVDMPFGLEGGIRMRYAYKIIDKDNIEFDSCGSFPAFGPAALPCPNMGALKGNYWYSEIFHADGTSDVTESPEF